MNTTQIMLWGMTIMNKQQKETKMISTKELLENSKNLGRGDARTVLV